jgi:hypothetical protein
MEENAYDESTNIEKNEKESIIIPMQNLVMDMSK